MAFWDYWLKTKTNKTSQMTKQDALEILNIGGAHFSSFGRDIAKSIIARSCIRPLAEHSSKLNVQIFSRNDKNIVRSPENVRLERLLSQSPNPFMNGKDFLYKTRYLLERENTAFIFIEHNTYDEIVAFWPIPFSNVEASLFEDEVWFTFTTYTGGQVVANMSQVAIIRQDYDRDLIAGSQPVDALQPALELIHTANQGLANTIKTSANLKGLLKSTKSMLGDMDRKKLADAFVKDYLNLENESGVAVLDASLEYVPVNGDKFTINPQMRKDMREDIMRYFGVNDNIMLSDFTPEKWEAFYESKIEPFGLALGLELTNKCFTEVERAAGNQIILAGNRLMFASTATKLQFTQMVDRGEMTPNEHRSMFGLAPLPGGDVPVIRGEYKNTTEITGAREGGE